MNFADDEARRLLAEGYQQTSGKYRHVARLPEDRTGLEALRDADPHAYAQLMDRIEREAASTYRRVYAGRNGDQLTLSEEVFAAFKRFGGEASW